MKREERLLPDDDLLSVNGGTQTEFDEIIRYIKKKDPRAYSAGMLKNKGLVALWLRDNVDGFEKCVYHQNGPNEYFVDDGSGQPLSQSELMKLIRSTDL